MKTLLGWGLLLLAFGTALEAAETAPTDLFRSGAVWTGHRRFEKDNGKMRLEKQGLVLRITEREGENFKGILKIEKNLNGQGFEVAVSGNAPVAGDGAVRFKTEKAGDLSQSFSGRCRGGILSLDFNGKSAGGQDVSGVASLQPRTK